MGKTISILGSTGSVGETTLRVLRFMKDEYRVHGLACRGNLDLLDRQIAEFNPAVVAVASGSAGGARMLKKKYPGTEFLDDDAGVAELAGREVDTIVSAIVGAAGLRPTLAAIGRARRIALANKETLVMAGGLFMKRIEEAGTELIPVDSEHSAVFSLLRAMDRGEVRRVILTASGGSLRELPLEELSAVTPQRALAHPTWSMGSKITIDSATLMNKGLEVIEAHHLFGVAYDAIDVLIHPESAVHSLVEAADGALYAHLGVADMALPVLNALAYPEKRENPFGRLRLEELGRLTFAACDEERYPALGLCYAAGRRGGTMPALLNAANEEAVGAFLSGALRFTDIVGVVERTMKSVAVRDDPDIGDIFGADSAARETARAMIEGGL